MEIPIDKAMQDLSVKKKILHIAGAFNIGGAETMLINVLRYIDKSRYHIDIAVSGSEEGFYEAEAGRLGSRIYHVPKRSESFIGHLTELNRLIKKERYDIVHINTQNAFFSGLELMAARAAGCKRIVLHCHSSNDWRSKKILFVHRLWKRYVYTHADVRLACSREAALWLFGTDKGVELFPLPVACENYLYDQDKYEQLRRSFGYEGRFIYVHVGRFVDVKNHAFLIEVFEELKKLKKESLLFLIGDGELKAEIEKQVKGKGLEEDVVFWGSIEDVYEKLMMADAFIFPSKYEGLPTVLLEAQAAGLPCFISDRISKDIDITDLITRLSIEDVPYSWALRISESGKCSNRESYNEIVNKKHGITTAIQALTEIYDR